MVRIILVIFLLSLNTFAKEGVVTVLEAPLFKIPDQNSFVTQHVRKGDKIYIHPSEMSRDKYDGLIDETYENIVKYDEKHANMYPDKLFKKGQTYFPEPSGKFYKTISKSGSIKQPRNKSNQVRKKSKTSEWRHCIYLPKRE